MSDIQRYQLQFHIHNHSHWESMDKMEDGDWVRYEDHEKVAAKLAAILLALEAAVNQSHCWLIGPGRRCPRVHCPACDARLLLEELAVEENI